MFDKILAMLAILLPTLFAVTVELVNRKTKERPAWRVGVITFGIAISAITGLQIYRSDRAHTEEVRQQREESQQVRAELRESRVAQQVSDAYFQAKLEEEAKFYGQLALLASGIKTLAETSAEFQRKLYKTKVAADSEVYSFAMNTVKEIRDFAQKRQAISDQELREMQNIGTIPGLSDAERQVRWNEMFENYRQISRAEDREFHSILADVMYATTELEKRKISEPMVDPATRTDVNRAFHGILAGVYPEVKLADYLQAWAKPLARSD
jgi:hypothetical protein